MATIQIEIESDGANCGKCTFISTHGCMMWPLATQKLHDGRFERCNECLMAEVTVTVKRRYRPEHQEDDGDVESGWLLRGKS